MANSKSKKTSKKEKSNGLNLLLIVFVFIIILFGTVVSNLLTISSNKHETEKLNKYYVTLQEQGASLNSEVVKLQDSEYIARYAREKYMFTKDGEIILRIIDGDDKIHSSDEKNEVNEDSDKKED